jgi:hypothetical protein
MGRERQLEYEHPDIVGTVNNFGIFYFFLKEYKSAEELLNRVQAGNEKATWARIRLSRHSANSV